jgi:CubicO group peptidase (beta-lactamase class C family)
MPSVRRGLEFGCLLAGLAVAVPVAGQSKASAGEEPGLGSPEGVLFWTPEEQSSGYPSYESVFPVRFIAASDHPLPLPERPIDLSHVSLESGGASMDLDGFMAANHVRGLLVLQKGDIVYERYAHGNTRDTRWVSFSVAKSVVSLLIGAAIQDGYIESLDSSVADYLPILKGSAYEAATIRDALQMASGVEWDESFTDPEADVNRLSNASTRERLEFLSGQPRVADPGTRFNYNSNEAHLVSSVLRAAIGGDLSSYLRAKIWEPMGMAANANWQLTEPDGAEYGGCCISATLRDYGRLGLFALSEGELPDGTRVLPEEWMAESTTPSAANPGYGYYWWLNQMPNSYSAIGVFGQMIWIDPTEEVVVVTHSMWPHPTALFPRGWAFASAIRDALRSDQP